MTAKPRDYLANTDYCGEDELLVLLALGIAHHHYPRHAYAQRTISNAAHVRQDDPSPADAGVGGELLRMEG